MKRKVEILKMFVGTFAVFGFLFISANSTFAQCGNYFKTNYSGIFKMQFPNSQIWLDDWTGDGRSDFWTIKRRAPDIFLPDILIYPSKPTGYWDWDNPIILTTSVSYISSDVKVADLDSDGRMDLYYGSNPIQILRNAGDGSLTTSAQLSDSDGSIGSNGHIGFADINGDGLLDWLYSIFINGNSQIRYQMQNPNGSFGSKTTILAASAQYGNSFVSNVVGDFNGDGKIDIVTGGNLNNTPNGIMLKNLGGGNFEIINNLGNDVLVFRVPVKDFNNDGRDDILSRNIIFYGRADGTFDRVPLPGGSAQSYNMLPAKLNGDGNWDVLEFGADYYAAYIGDGAGNFSKTVYQKSIGGAGGWKLEDFDGDGKTDLYDSRTNVQYKYNIFGERLISIMENICQPSGETKLANLDGNPNADVMTWNPNNGNWSSKNAIWGSGADPTTKDFQWGSGAHNDVPAPGDFDGDGRTDYSVYRNSTGVWYIFRSSDSTWQAFQFGLTGDIAVPNDYDGGGKTDIAVFRPSEGNWYIWFSEAQQFLGLHFGSTGDKPVPADFDGDGETDVAVFRPSTGVWYYLKSSNGDFVAVQWGIATDIPVPADYDGDGRADLTVYRDGIWWILRSSDNSYTAIEWGNAGDIPLPVYRNSVSADMTLYRPSNNSWYSFDFKYNAGISLGGSPGVPVYFGLPNN